MKVLGIVTGLLMLSAPALANDVVRDSSGAWSCQSPSGEVIRYYQPFGRAPTHEEQLACKTSGGRVAPPATKTEATPVEEKKTK